MSSGPIFWVVSVYDKDECKAVPSSRVITLFPEDSMWLQDLIPAYTYQSAELVEASFLLCFIWIN